MADDVVASSPVVYFGPKWDVPILDHAQQVAAPVGERCYECGEPVADGDRGFIRAAVRMVDDDKVISVEPVHAECDLRAVMGHQVGVCSCTGHGHDRPSARLVWRRVEQQRGTPW